MKLCKDSVNPYLRQMAEGAIQWLEWNEDTLKRAAALDRPVCLCVIRSTGRLCRAMKDNFDHSEIARMLNHDFVPVLADGADSPQLALAARSAARIMSQPAGWPLFLFMTPLKKPFFATSYMPQSSEDSRMPGLLQVLRRSKWLWLMKRPQIDEAADSCASRLAQFLSPNPVALREDFAETAAAHLLEEEDAGCGGFGKSAKFPQASKLVLAAALICRGVQKDRLTALLQRSLASMFAGGLYDHLGGGFHDYCVDREWLQPCLGKHLEQNAAILDAYLDGYKLFETPLYRYVAERSLDALTARFDRGDGLLCAGEDIYNSEATKSYYLWEYDELTKALGSGAEDFCGACGALPGGNYKDPVTLEGTGKNVLTSCGLPGSFAESDEKADLRAADFAAKREALLKLRGRRMPPQLEERVSVCENAAIAAVLAKASRLFGRPEYLERAQKIMKALLTNSVSEDGLCRALYGAKITGAAALDDFAQVIRACVELYLSSRSAELLQTAKSLCVDACSIFGAHGAMRFVPSGTDEVAPAWEPGDDILPSGNSVMVDCLAALYEITGDRSLRARAEEIVQAFGGILSEYPSACAGLAAAALRLQSASAK